VVVTEALGRLRFERNDGQTHSQVRFLSRGRGYGLFLTPSEVVLSLRRAHDARCSGQWPHSLAQWEAQKFEQTVLRMKFVNASPGSEISGLDELAGKSNYFVGNDPKQWRLDVPHYDRIVYRDLWKGIDLAFYGTSQGQLESDFTVSPGASPSVIRLAFEGAREVRLDGTGNLVLKTALGNVIHHRPLIYQRVGAERRVVTGSWVLKGKSRVGFEVGSYDDRQPLVIDPVLVYSTYLGGSGFDQGRGVAMNTEGHAYVIGTTYSVDFPLAGNPFQPVKGGGMDVFIAKLDLTLGGAAGLRYSTYLGGINEEYGQGIAVDAAGNAYVTGWTGSANFPIAGNPFQATLKGPFDAFVTKLSPTLGLVYSTFLGGSGHEQGFGIAVDAAGDAYVTGFTMSTDFPLTGPPLQPTFGGHADAYVAKLSLTTGLLHSSYLGGSGWDAGSGIAVDAAGDAYLTGFTQSTNFPLAGTLAQPGFGGGPEDAFVVKVSPISGLVNSTYLGGNDSEEHYLGIAVDAAGNAYVTGNTRSPDFPTAGTPSQATLAGPMDAFVAKFGPTSSLLYSTYLGGSDQEDANGIAVDGAGNAYVTGVTSSTDFPTAGGPFQPANAGGGDVFVTKLSPNSDRLYSTYLGGGGGESGNGIATDVQGSILLTGETGSATFPLAGNPFQPIQGGGTDAFVTRIQADSIPPPQTGPNDFYTVTPCRLIDTRNANALLGGPALYAKTNRNFVVVGRCEIPATAKAVSLNIAATAQSAAGHLSLYPGGTTPPTASSLNYAAGQTRANNAIVMLGPLGDFGVRCVQGSGTAHLIVDVNGYFE